MSTITAPMKFRDLYKRYKSHRIKIQLALFLGCFLSLIVLILGYAIAYHFETTTQELRILQTSDVLKKLTTEIDTRLNTVHQHLTTLIETDIIRQFYHHQHEKPQLKQALQHLFKQYYQLYPDYQQIWLLSTDSEVNFYFNSEGNYHNNQKIPYYMGYTIYDQLKNKDKTTVWFSENNQPSFYLAHKIKYKGTTGKQFYGYLVAELSARLFTESMRQIQLDKAGDLAILRDTGQLVYHSQYSQMSKKNIKAVFNQHYPQHKKHWNIKNFTSQALPFEYHNELYIARFHHAFKQLFFMLYLPKMDRQIFTSMKVIALPLLGIFFSLFLFWLAYLYWVILKPIDTFSDYLSSLHIETKRHSSTLTEINPTTYVLHQYIKQWKEYKKTLLRLKSYIKQKKSTQQQQLLIIKTALQQEKLLFKDTQQINLDSITHLSYKLRTPLHGIVAVVELLLLEKSFTAQQSVHLNILKESTLQLTKVIDSLFKVSALETKQMYSEEYVFNLNYVVNTLVNHYKEKAYQKSLAFDFISPSTLPHYVRGDKEKMTHILTHLLDNALKFTEKGMIRFTINTKHTKKQQVQLVFKVFDTGVGMNIAKVNSIFKHLNLAENYLYHKQTGTGFNLTLSYQLARLLGGQLSVETQEGQGCCFSLLLSFVTTEHPAVINSRHFMKLTQASLPQVTEHVSIILITPRKITQHTIKYFLSKLACDIAIFDMTATAIDYLQQNHVDIIFTELYLPEMDAFTLTTVIRRQHNTHYKRIPIVALSASSLIREREHCIAAGMNDYLQQPVTYINIMAVLKRWLAHRLVESDKAIEC